MAELKKGMHPGATWKKVDFQIHTPRDPQWQGSPHIAGGTPEKEDARMQWAKGFVGECIERGLDAIAITDHHDFCFVEYVQRAIDQLPPEQPHPWIFPGVEVTCRDSVQCLVLFDCGTAELQWMRIFGGHLQNIGVPDRNLPTNPQATQCGQDIDDFILSVTKDSQLNSCSIILPHASNTGAHKSMIRNGFAPRFKELPFDGVYCDKSFQQLDDVTKRKIYGEILEWGLRRRGIIPTGDNRRQTFQDLGTNDCWIRLGEPTAESIRQAVLADEARIAYEHPSLPVQRIVRLMVKSTLTGDDFHLIFNDGFTALIGGRGAGKSAVLEYLRFGLGRSATDTNTSEGTARERDLSLKRLNLEASLLS